MQSALLREKALLEIRRPTKTVLFYYNMIEKIIDYLKNDDTIISLLEELRENLINNKDKIETEVYRPRQSNIMKADIVTTEHKAKKYNCSVPCYNLYGSTSIEILKANRWDLRRK